jgi:outer membrane protein TolC
VSSEIHPARTRLRAVVQTCWLAGALAGTAPAPASEALRLTPSLTLSTAPAPETSPQRTAPSPTTWPALLADLERAPGIQEAQARAEASSALGEQGEARAWWPRLDASLRADDQRQRYGGVASRTPSSAATVQATWPLWRPADRAEARAQALDAEQARWQAVQRARSMARELSATYLDAVETAEHVRLARGHLLALRHHEQAHDKRLQAGLGTVVDLLETRTRQGQAHTREAQLLSRLGSLTLAMSRLSGRRTWPPAGLHPQAPPLPSLPLPALDEALSMALSQHPDVLEAQAGVRASRARIDARVDERWQPTLDATASRSRTRQTQRFEGLIDRQDVRVDAVGVVLNWPIFSGGYQPARQREAAALLDAAQARLDEAEARVRAELRDAYQRHDRARRQQTRQQAVVDSTRATLEAIRRAWLAGLRSTTDLLDAQQQLHDAEVASATARITAMRSGVDALAWLNQLDAAHLSDWLAQFDHTPIDAIDAIDTVDTPQSPSSPFASTRPWP